MATEKKSKNNPNVRQVKQIKPRESSHCEENCKEVGICEKYKDYMEKLRNGKIGHGIYCDKQMINK